MNKLVVERVYQVEQGGGTEYLSLVYEHSWGVGLAMNQLQFLADEINNGHIKLPEPEREMPITELTKRMGDIMTEPRPGGIGAIRTAAGIESLKTIRVNPDLFKDMSISEIVKFMEGKK